MRKLFLRHSTYITKERREIKQEKAFFLVVIVWRGEIKSASVPFILRQHKQQEQLINQQKNRTIYWAQAPILNNAADVPSDAATVQHGITRAVVRCQAMPPRFNTILHGWLSGARRGRHGSTRFYTGGCQVPGEAATVQHGFTRAIVRCLARPPRFNTVLHGRLSGARRGRQCRSRPRASPLARQGQCCRGIFATGMAASVGAGLVPARWPVRASVAAVTTEGTNRYLNRCRGHCRDNTGPAGPTGWHKACPYIGGQPRAARRCFSNRTVRKFSASGGRTSR